MEPKHLQQKHNAIYGESIIRNGVGYISRGANTQTISVGLCQLETCDEHIMRFKVSETAMKQNSHHFPVP